MLRIMHVRFVCAVLCLIMNSVNAQLYDACTVESGQKGKCLYFKDCPSAQHLVRINKPPTHCGFNGREPIVCCDEKSHDKEINKRSIGAISKQICNETYYEESFKAPVALGPIYVKVNTTNTVDFAHLLALSNNRTKRDYSASISIDQEPEEEDRTYEPSVVGGDNSEAKEFPHMALIGYGVYPSISWACGGSLVNEKFVLTAGHCIHTRLGSAKYVRLGELDLNSTSDVADPHDFTIKRVIRHPEYKPPLVYHDIALVELENPVVYSDFIKPACLHTEREINEKLWIATGWGATKFGGAAASFLQQVSLKESTHEECQNSFRYTSKRRLSHGIDQKTQICAGELEKDTCQGDSGGPLQVKHPDYLFGYKIIGVTSFGVACGIGQNPAVYTRVSHYIEWIESIVWP